MRFYLCGVGSRSGEGLELPEEMRINPAQIQAFTFNHPGNDREAQDGRIEGWAKAEQHAEDS